MKTVLKLLLQQPVGAPPEGSPHAEMTAGLHVPTISAAAFASRGNIGAARKTSGQNSDESDEFNNYEGFAKCQVLGGSLEADVLGHNLVINETNKHLTETALYRREMAILRGEIRHEQDLAWTNEQFYPYSTILRAD